DAEEAFRFLCSFGWSSATNIFTTSNASSTATALLPTNERASRLFRSRWWIPDHEFLFFILSIRHSHVWAIRPKESFIRDSSCRQQMSFLNATLPFTAPRSTICNGSRKSSSACNTRVESGTAGYLDRSRKLH